jgi:hypothetical protein
LLHTEFIPVVVAAERIHTANTSGNVRVVTTGSFMSLAAISLAGALAAVLWAVGAALALSLLTPAITTTLALATVFRAGLAGLSNGLLTLVIAALLRGILADPLAIAHLPVGATAAAAAAAVIATLFVTTLRHADTLPEVVANRAAWTGTAAPTAAIIATGLIVALGFAKAAPEIVTNVPAGAFTALAATAIFSTLFANAIGSAILALVPFVLAGTGNCHLPTAVVRFVATNGAGAATKCPPLLFGIR